MAEYIEREAECPVCHGTGRIGTTDWLTKGMSEKQLAKEKQEAIAEHERQLRAEMAREIFEEIEKWLPIIDYPIIAKLKKKYTEVESNG